MKTHRRRCRRIQTLSAALRITATLAGLPLCLGSARTLHADEWRDSYYSYRVPISIDIPGPGVFCVDLTPDTITRWINEKADFKFVADRFAYNQILLVERTENETNVISPVNAGYCMATVGPELVVNGTFENQTDGIPVGWNAHWDIFKLAQSSYNGSWCMTVTGADMNACCQAVKVEPSTWYQFSCRGRNNLFQPMYTPKNGSDKRFLATYVDPYSPLEAWHTHRYYFNTGDTTSWNTQAVSIKMLRYTGSADDVSLRKCRIEFILNATTCGNKMYWLYYAPLECVIPTVPSQTALAMPGKTLKLQRTGPVECLDDEQCHALPSQSLATMWSAPSMKKVLEHAPAPRHIKPKISLSCAKNEGEAAQLVLSPIASGTVTSVHAILQEPGGYTLGKNEIEIRRAVYVPIKTSSGQHQGRPGFIGALPDPLPKFTPVTFKAGDPNILIWVDVRVPKTAPAGSYTGAIQLTTSAGDVYVPLELKVWDFSLPDIPTCRSSFQVSRYLNNYLWPWHKVTDPEDKYALTKQYTAEMARYRMGDTAPCTAANFAPKTEAKAPYWIYETMLPWALDELHVPGFSIGHESGPLMRKLTDERTQKQVAYYESLATYLSARGWLKSAYLQIDEPQPMDFEKLKTWIGEFRSQPHAKHIKMLIYAYYGVSWDALRDVVDILVPHNNDKDSSISPIGISKMRPGTEVWAYWTSTAHQYIDAPGIDQRIWGPKYWSLGLTGVSSWAMLIWWNEKGTTWVKDNPWKDPWSSYGNGVFSYFYPPSSMGPDLIEKDLTITPSLRLVLFRDGIEDFEYGALLEHLVKEGKAKGKGTAQGEKALKQLRRPFISPVQWTIGESYWSEVRTTAAEAIEQLSK